MAKKLTPKQRFLVLLKRTRNYVGDTALTRRLYRKFLKIYNSSGVCLIKDLFGSANPRSMAYYTARGHAAEYAKQRVRQIQSRGIQFYNGDDKKIKERVDKRQKTFDSKSKEEIDYINSLKSKNNDAEHVAKKYNITVEEAVERIKVKNQKRVESYKKHLDKIGGYKKEWSKRCKEYHMARGHSEEESIAIVKNLAIDTRSVGAIAARYNVDLKTAKQMQQKVLQKCRDTFFSRPIEEQREILIKRTKHNRQYSQASQKFIYKILEQLEFKDKLKMYYGDTEHILFDSQTKKFYAYDFTVKSLNLIVEYNGLLFHPRQNDTWATTVADSVSKDETKKRTAEHYGFTLIYVWEDEDLDLKAREVVDIIRSRYTILTNANSTTDSN